MSNLNLPEWALKFKTKGKTIRRRSDGTLILFSVKSTRIPGCSYPKVSQEYLGIITENGLIPKKLSPSTSFIALEYGLSRFIFANFKRSISRHFADVAGTNSATFVAISIIYFLFESLDDTVLKYTYLSTSLDIGSMRPFITQKREKTFLKMKLIITDLISRKFDSQQQALNFMLYLRSIVALKYENHYEFSSLPDEISALIKEKGWIY